MENLLMTSSKLAEKYNVKRQSIIVKIKEGRLPGKKKYGRWFILEEDYLNYIAHRYKRLFRHNGKPLYNKEKGILSPKDAACEIGCNVNKIYYNLRKGRIKSDKYYSSWVINIDDLMEFKKFTMQNMARKC